jgi:hypothetical protein
VSDLATLDLGTRELRPRELGTFSVGALKARFALSELLIVAPQQGHLIIEKVAPGLERELEKGAELWVTIRNVWTAPQRVSVRAVGLYLVSFDLRPRSGS